MGGTALDIFGVKTRRQTRPELDVIFRQLHLILAPYCTNFQETIFYRRKDSFGDLDILISSETRETITILREKIQSLVDQGLSKGVVRNDTVISFEWSELQVDLIWFHNDEFDTAEFYYSYNDLHNLIGKIADYHNLHFGQWGLKWDTHIGQKTLKVILETDRRKIYEALGYDYDQYLKGFDSIEEIFDFVLTSTRFDYRAFLEENMDYRNRTRNKKRPLYQRFLVFLEDKPKIEAKLPPYTQEEIFSKWAHRGVKLQYLTFQKDILNDAIVREKFSGYTIQQLVGLQGKALGTVMADFKFYLMEKGIQSFQAYVLETDLTEIKKVFMEWYNSTISTSSSASSL